jgi:damage-control phosphatase, subfamily I
LVTGFCHRLPRRYIINGWSIVMKFAQECYPCLAKLIENSVNMATEDKAVRARALKEAMRILDAEFSLDAVSIDVATPIHDRIKIETGNPDPYRELKNNEIRLAKELFEQVRPLYNNDFDGLLRLAVLGNSMDFFRPLETMDRNEILRKIDFYIDDSRLLLERVRKARKMLYLADNSGEAYFDLPLVNYFKTITQVTYVVKGRPIQNDATLADLQLAGLDCQFEEIIDTGTATPGIIMSQASAEFLKEYNNADLIFAKGMGYYEALSELPRDQRVFYCFKAKCKPVADSIGVPVDAFVLKQM